MKTENAKDVLRAKAMRLFSALIAAPDGSAPKYLGGVDPRRVAVIKDMKRLDVDFYFGERDDNFVIFTDAGPDVVWPIDVGMIWDHSDEGDEYIIANRFVSETPKSLRNIARLFSKHMASLYWMRVDSHRFSAKVPIAFLSNKWVNVRSGQEFEWSNKSKETFIPLGAINDNESEASTTHLMGCAAITAALKRRYEWGVEFSTVPNAPSLIFTTDPTGIKAMFDDREGGERGRRDSLVNWVGEHWRGLRSDPDVETYVRRHMRGEPRFEWRGFSCRVHPPLLDVEKDAELKEQRELMRLSATDRRRVPGA